MLKRTNTTFLEQFISYRDDFEKSIYCTLMLALLHGKVDRLNQLTLSETKPAIKLQSLPFLFF